MSLQAPDASPLQAYLASGLQVRQLPAVVYDIPAVVGSYYGCEARKNDSKDETSLAFSATGYGTLAETAGFLPGLLDGSDVDEYARFTTSPWVEGAVAISRQAVQVYTAPNYYYRRGATPGNDCRAFVNRIRWGIPAGADAAKVTFDVTGMISSADGTHFSSQKGCLYLGNETGLGSEAFIGATKIGSVDVPVLSGTYEVAGIVVGGYDILIFGLEAAWAFDAYTSGSTQGNLSGVGTDLEQEPTVLFDVP